MKTMVLVCLLMVVGWNAQDAVVQTGAFAEADRLGEGPSPTFFLFSTEYGKYVIRYDGLGEIGTHQKKQQYFQNQFYLKTGMTGRVERMYFLEYEGDLLLAFEVRNIGYVRRMNQQTRKMRWLTPIDAAVVNQCVVEGSEVHCGDGDNLTKIDLNTGARRKE